MKLISLTFALISMLVSNCQEQVQSSDIQKITFGTSFGSCMGYCTQIVELTEGSVKKTLIPRVSQSLQDKSCQQQYDAFMDVFAKVDLMEFHQLEETIGCPDCADGGAEWIEITTQEGSKKVTYEFGKAPKAVKPFIKELRSIYDNLGTCEDSQ